MGAGKNRTRVPRTLVHPLLVHFHTNLKIQATSKFHHLTHHLTQNSSTNSQTLQLIHQLTFQFTNCSSPILKMPHQIVTKVLQNHHKKILKILPKFSQKNSHHSSHFPHSPISPIIHPSYFTTFSHLLLAKSKFVS